MGQLRACSRSYLHIHHLGLVVTERTWKGQEFQAGLRGSPAKLQLPSNWLLGAQPVRYGEVSPLEMLPVGSCSIPNAVKLEGTAIVLAIRGSVRILCN